MKIGDVEPNFIFFCWILISQKCSTYKTTVQFKFILKHLSSNWGKKAQLADEIHQITIWSLFSILFSIYHWNVTCKLCERFDISILPMEYGYILHMRTNTKLLNGCTFSANVAVNQSQMDFNETEVYSFYSICWASVCTLCWLSMASQRALLIRR